MAAGPSEGGASLRRGVGMLLAETKPIGVVITQPSDLAGPPPASRRKR